ncbi:MAG TPA: NADH-quinone oxidoreductase subunit L, partial [Gemmataceae bacterium]|nr:NADH-quinone oxidoreductase subunit L [Gemmataceae bacterium]
VSDPVTWFAAGNLVVHFTITVDPLSCVMLAMITFVATWIAIFSAGYMHGDRGYVRFFAVMSLFVFSMCGLVLANNFLLLLAFWEGVGLCSYLLVGYYFERPSAAAAARKAFLVTRLGDTGFILGIFMLWRLSGFTTTDLGTMFELVSKTVTEEPGRVNELTMALLCLFCGAIGKSAQFPLYVWLPDAMEGPTPVSALIHAATMVTAGVYLVARCAPLFALAPVAQVTVAWVGGITAILAAFIALAQTDLKRVLAYSTVSQLGYMFLALGTLGAVSPGFAVTAALFHLFTHAFFKALLFLAAGSVMHAMGDVIDMRRFGGLRKVMPVTHLTFLCGAAALAGVPLLSGFWSKDMILEALYLGADGNSPYSGVYYLLLLVALLTAGMTAFYTFRAYFLTFWGELRTPPEAGDHAHESPPTMTIPLLVLAIGAVGIGALVEPFTHWFSHFLGRTPGLGWAGEAPHVNWALAGVGTLLVVGGFALAYMAYGKGRPQAVPAPLEPFYAMSRDKLYVDEVYHFALVRPAEWLAFMARVFDLFLDSLARLLSAVPRFLGAAVRPIQNGLIQFYALSMALGLAVFLAFVVFRITR